MICLVGKVKIWIFVGYIFGLLVMFIEGDEIKLDIGWIVSNFIEEYLVGWSLFYVDIVKDLN